MNQPHRDKQDQGLVQANCQLSKDLEEVEGSQVKIVEIYFSEEDKRTIDFSQPILGEEPFDVQDLAQVFSKAAEAFTGTAQQLSRIDMIEFSGVMEESARALLKSSESIDSILEEIREISKKTKRLLDRVEQKLSDDQLFKFFYFL